MNGHTARSGRAMLCETEHSRMWRDGNVMRIEVREGAVINENDAVQDLAGDWDRVFDGPFGILVDIRGITSIDRGAREHYAKHGSPDSRIAGVALVVDSTISRLIANFFIGFNMARWPVRVFNDIQGAESWLEMLLAEI